MYFLYNLFLNIHVVLVYCCTNPTNIFRSTLKILNQGYFCPFIQDGYKLKCVLSELGV